MGSLVPELGLDLKLFTKRTIFGCLNDEVTAGSRAAKLEDFARRLEEERRKIEVFKRELPLCMLLLAEVIGGLKLETEQCLSGCVIEEFIPVEIRSSEAAEKKDVDLEDGCKEKMEWMSSAQLWSDNLVYEKKAESLSLESKNGGAFVPFKDKKLSIPLPDLSLVPPLIDSSCSAPNRAVADEDNHSCGMSSKGVAISSSSAGNDHMSLQPQYQQNSQRKARRCWSPELHRRFIMALQQLGGAQVATPKQIRELMKVDGLTNDEVKSHLQKYRLHTRRMPSSSASQVHRPVVMVGGGLWVSQGHCTASQQNASQSESPQGPLQLACAAAQALSVTGGDSCDDDGKSESYSWK